MSSEIIEYIGEFGTEVNTFIPFIYYLKTNNMLQHKVVLYQGMKPYYFFLDDSEIIFKEQKRYWIPHTARLFLPDSLKDDVVFYNTYNPHPQYYLPPPYSEFYSKYKVHTSKPIAIIQNKYNAEWGHPPMNYFDVQTLKHMLDILTSKYYVIYIRSNNLVAPGYSRDMNEDQSIDMEDKEMIRANFSNHNVGIIEDLLPKTSYDFNTFKCILHANAELFISVVGGHIDFSNYFPGTHIIYIKWLPDCFKEGFYYHQHSMMLPNNTDKMYIASTHTEVITACRIVTMA